MQRQHSGFVESILGRKGSRDSEVKRKQIRKMAGETENFGIAEFSIRIRDRMEQNRLMKIHTPTHIYSIDSPLFRLHSNMVKMDAPQHFFEK